MHARSKAWWLFIALTASVPCAIAQETIRVGVIASRTGPLAEYGIEAVRAIELAQAASRVKMEVVSLDDASSPDNAIAAARRLLSEHRVHVIVGPTGIASSTALVPVLKDSPKTALISLTAAPSGADGKPEYFFRIGTTEGHLMAFAKDFMQKNLSVKEIAVVAASRVFAPGVTAEEAFSEFRATPFHLPADLRLQAVDTRPLQAAKATYLSLNSIPSPAGALRALRGSTPAPLVVASLFGLRPFVEQEDANSFVVTMRDDEYAVGKQFREAFAKANGGQLPVSGFGARAYSAIQVIEQAAIRGTFRVGAPDASETLAKTISGGSFDTILGKMVLRPREGCSPLPLGIYKLDKGRTLAAAVTGNPCDCTDSGCCDSCCKDKKVDCKKDKSCS
jgi:ABC-type branched-subunit amino acid transport system substrate-binding protein